jgi:hypothetical protein
MTTATITRPDLRAALMQYQGQRGFLGSVAGQLARYGRLSDKQWDTVTRILAERQAQRGPAGTPDRDTPAECGLYRHDGRLYVVREFTPQGERDKVRFCRELVPNTGSEADRADGYDQAVKVHAIKAPHMQYRLAPEEAVTLEECKALGVQFGECVICGTPIETKESVVDRGGIGPVCYGRQSALLARKAAAAGGA